MYRFSAFPLSASCRCDWMRVRYSSVFQSKSIFCLIRMFGTLTSIVVRLHRWVPANQPSVEHWSISTSCRLMSTRTTPLQRQEDTINPAVEELSLSAQSEGSLQVDSSESLGKLNYIQFQWDVTSHPEHNNNSPQCCSICISAEITLLVQRIPHNEHLWFSIKNGLVFKHACD